VKSTKAALPKASPIAAPPRPAKQLSAAVAEIDPALREYLREWRRAAAKQQGVPAFVVMHDFALDEVCRKRPTSIPELLNISGFGEYKAALYGPRIFEALEQFRNGARATPLDGTETPPRPAKRASGL
jgi:ATP-dependent DNA helicase RecQ